MTSPMPSGDSKRGKRGPGRPRKSSAERRDVIVQLRLTESQSRRVESAVATLGGDEPTVRDLLLWAAEMRLQR